MTETEGLLVRILAETDAVFLPPRAHQWGTGFPANCYLARRSYLGSGIPWRMSEGCDAAERMAASRLLGDVASRGLLTLTRSKRIRWPLVKLTLASEEVARRLAEMPSVFSGVLLMREVHRLAADLGRWWVSERKLCSPPALPGDAPDKHDLRAIECMGAPVVLRGWLESLSTSQGEVRYRLTRAGLAVLADECRLWDETEPEDGDPEAIQQYEDSLATAIERLESKEAGLSSRELGFIRLPVGG